MEQRRLTPEFKPQPIYPLRVVMGPQDEAFSDEGIRTFLSGTYTVTKEFDRMGCRLEGEVIAHRESGDIISDGIAFGAIQVDPGRVCGRGEFYHLKDSSLRYNYNTFLLCSQYILNFLYKKRKKLRDQPIVPQLLLFYRRINQPT